MTIAEIIQPGDKVDISSYRMWNGQKDQSMPKIYKARCWDLGRERHLRFPCRWREEKLVLLPLGIRWSLSFLEGNALPRRRPGAGALNKEKCMHVRDRIKIPDLQSK